MHPNKRHGDWRAGLLAGLWAGVVMLGLGAADAPRLEDAGGGSSGGTAATAAPNGPAQVYRYKGMLFKGWYINSDSERFTLRLASDDDGASATMTLPWSGATAAERAALYRQFGVPAIDDAPVFGARVDAERVTLKSGLVYYGFTTLVATEGKETVVNLTTREIRSLQLDPAEIERIELVPAFESQVFSNEDIYTRHKLVQGGLKSATDHFKLAELCLQLYLPEEGLDQLAIAAELDRRFNLDEGEAGKLQEALKDMRRRKAGDEQVRLIEQQLAAHDYAAAHDTAERYMKVFPEHPTVPYVRKLAQIIDARKADVESAAAIAGVYSEFYALIKDKVTTPVAAGVTLPAKRVIGTQGQIWEGTVAEETVDTVTLNVKLGNAPPRPLKIFRTSIKQILDIELPGEAGAPPKKLPTWNEIKSWVTTDRFAKDLYERVAAKTNLPPATVQKYWEGRLTVEMTVGPDGQLVMGHDNTRRQTIEVGAGSFLMAIVAATPAPGAQGRWTRPTPLPPSNAQQAAAQQQQTAWRNNNGKKVQVPIVTAPQATGPQPQDIQPLTDSDWWEQAGPTVRLQAAQGILAERFFYVESSSETVCATCAGKGYLSDPGVNGQTVYKCCPACNGNQHLAKLVAK